MKRTVFSVGLIASVLALAGCTGGTTYGTGTTHEEATMKGLSNIFSLKSQKTNIDYNHRPELVMPANKNILPPPVSKEAVLSDGQWPETPEERIAKVRSDAPEPDYRTGDLPVEYLNSEKKGINISTDRKSARTNVRAAEEQWLTDIRNDANGISESKKARKLKEEIAFSTGVKRKYLTEPPVEYRAPAATAEAGDLGISDEELEARQKAERAENRGIEKAVVTENGTF